MKHSDEARAEFKEEMACIDANMVVWINETGTDRRDCHRRCDYHMRGMTPICHAVDIRGK